RIRRCVFSAFIVHHFIYYLLSPSSTPFDLSSTVLFLLPKNLAICLYEVHVQVDIIGMCVRRPRTRVVVLWTPARGRVGVARQTLSIRLAIRGLPRLAIQKVKKQSPLQQRRKHLQ